MSEDPQFRQVGDRIVTESQYQSELANEQMASTASRFKIITVPAGVISAIFTFLALDINGWLWKCLISAVVGFLVYLWLIPGLVLLVIAGVIYFLYLSGAFG